MSAFRLRTLQKIGRADNIELESSDTLISSPKLIKRNIRTNPNVNSNKPTSSSSKFERDMVGGSIRSILSSSLDNDINDDDVLMKEEICENENEFNKIFLDACNILSLLLPNFSPIGPNAYFFFHQYNSVVTANNFISSQSYEQSSFILDHSVISNRVNQSQTVTHNWKAGRLALKLTHLKQLIEKRRRLNEKYNLINKAIHLSQTEHLLEDIHNQDSSNIYIEYSLEDSKSLAILNLYEVCDELRIDHHSIESIMKSINNFSNIYYQRNQLKSLNFFLSDLISYRVYICLHKNNLMWASSCIKAGISALSREDPDNINGFAITTILRGVQDFNYLVSIFPKILSKINCFALGDLLNEISRGHGNLAAMSFFEFILSISQDESQLIQSDNFWAINKEMYELIDCDLNIDFDYKLADMYSNRKLINFSDAISPLSDYIRRENLFIDELFRSVCHATKFLTANTSKINFLSELTTEFSLDSSIQLSKNMKKVNWNDENLSMRAKALSRDFVINLWTSFVNRLEDFHMDSSVIVTLNQNQFETEVACLAFNNWSAAISLRHILISSTSFNCVPAMLNSYLHQVAQSISSNSALMFIIQSYSSIIADLTNQSENNKLNILNNFEFINQSEKTLKLIDSCDLILADALLNRKYNISVIIIIVNVIERMASSLNNLINNLETFNVYMSISFVDIMNKMPIICDHLQRIYNFLEKVLSLLSKKDKENSLITKRCTISYKNIDKCLVNILEFSNEMKKKFLKSFSSKCGQFFLDNLPNTKTWQLQLDKQHNAYIQNAVSDILTPMFTLILNLNINISNKYSNANMNIKNGELNFKEDILRIFGDEWMKSILLKKIKFSYEGACLLERDVKYVRDWLRQKQSSIFVNTPCPELINMQASGAFSLETVFNEEDINIIDNSLPASSTIVKSNESMIALFKDDFSVTVSTDGLSGLDAVVFLLKQQPINNNLQQQGLINSFQKAFSSVIDLRKFDLIKKNLSPTHSVQAMPTSGAILKSDSSSCSQTLMSDNIKNLNSICVDHNLSNSTESPTSGIIYNNFNCFDNCQKAGNNLINVENQKIINISLNNLCNQLPEVKCQKSNEVNYGYYTEINYSNNVENYENNLNLSPVASNKTTLNTESFSFTIPTKKQTTSPDDAIDLNLEATIPSCDNFGINSEETCNNVVHRSKWLRLRLNGSKGEKRRRNNVRWVRFIALCLGNSTNHSSTEDSSTADNLLL